MTGKPGSPIRLQDVFGSTAVEPAARQSGVEPPHSRVDRQTFRVRWLDTAFPRRGWTRHALYSGICCGISKCFSYRIIAITST